MPDDSLFLCLDTSTPTARVAVLDGGGAVRFTAEETAARHSTHVLALCARALEAVGIAPAGLAGIACGGGPGSFTGLRVGLAVAKGLALPTAVPLYLVSSLEALALDLFAVFGPEITAVPCLDAGKGEVYVAAYARAGEAQLVREVLASGRMSPGDVAPWMAKLERPILAGNGRDRHPATLAVGPDVSSVRGPTAVSVGKLALLQQARGEAADLERAVPFYGRPPDITVPGKK
jgi:tRNA threonylcarbamoyladenosine biosynthesis protein TsaB